MMADRWMSLESLTTSSPISRPPPRLTPASVRLKTDAAGTGSCECRTYCLHLYALVGRLPQELGFLKIRSHLLPSIPSSTPPLSHLQALRIVPRLRGDEYIVRLLSSFNDMSSILLANLLQTSYISVAFASTVHHHHRDRPPSCLLSYNVLGCCPYSCTSLVHKEQSHNDVVLFWTTLSRRP